ncbi:MAG: hypothetical protein EXS38_10115 [Opitutus sp.]|nr:hypothetical protein [Opitutus sp.]
MIHFRTILRWSLAFGGGPAIGAAANVDHFTDNGYGNPVSTLQHPAAEHFNGVTYVAYSGPHEDPYVAAYDHAAGKWIGPVQAGVNPMGKSPDQVDPGELDNHGRPALIVDRQGYLHLIFGAHGGEPSAGLNQFGMAGKGRFTHVVSQKPGDITAWKTLDNVSPFGTYSQWVKMANGDLYLFYRHGSHRSDWVYQKSVDDGRSFAPEVSVLKHKVSADKVTVVDSWYAWFDNGQGNTITASYVYHPCASPGHNAHRNNTYYMLMDGRDDSWTNVQGERATLPVTKESADKLTLIQATGKEKSNHGTCHIDADGRPHLFFHFPHGEARYYRWDGKAWQKPTTVADASGRAHDGDFIIDSPLKVRMLMDQNVAGTGSVGWWNTADGGRTWAKGENVYSLKDTGFEVTALVRNAHPDARMLVAGKLANQEHLYHHMYLLGDHGPVGRPALEASHLGDRLETIKAMPKTKAKAEAKKKKKEGMLDDDP